MLYTGSLHVAYLYPAEQCMSSTLCHDVPETALSANDACMFWTPRLAFGMQHADTNTSYIGQA